MGATPRATGLSRVIDVSNDGRIALGDSEVRDVVRNRTLRKLPFAQRYEYYGISDDGRYVSYTKTARLKGCAVRQPKVRDRVTNRTRFVATTASGRMLRPKWTPTDCWGETPGFSAPALSGNGRYVAFCANLRTSDRVDSYVKDLKRGTLRMTRGGCSLGISANGRIVLLGRDTEPGTSPSFSLQIGGSELRDGIVGADPKLTEDGSAVFATRGAESIRYDIASGSTVALPPPSPSQTPARDRYPGSGSMSSTGRYALLETRPGPPQTGLHLLVYDRTTATVTDLTPMFLNAGVQLSGDEDTGAYPLPPIISGDGKVVFAFSENGQYYALNWTG